MASPLLLFVPSKMGNETNGQEAAMANVKLHIDFWNLQLSWNSYFGVRSGHAPVRLGWRNLPAILVSELPTILGAGTPFVHKGTRVYASVNPEKGGRDEPLKKFLFGTLGQFTGYQVMVRDRHSKTDGCPHCHKEIKRTIEKGVDTSIVSDLFDGAINDAYDVAVLISNDLDFVPPVQMIQDRLQKQVVHVGFKSGGHHLRTACWGHLLLDDALAQKLRVTDPAPTEIPPR